MRTKGKTPAVECAQKNMVMMYVNLESEIYESYMSPKAMRSGGASGNQVAHTVATWKSTTTFLMAYAPPKQIIFQ